MGHEMVGQLIEVATMRAGLTVNAKLDKTQYPINMEVTAEDDGFREPQIACMCMGKWAYAIRPTRCICRP